MVNWAAECDVLMAGSGGGGVTGAYTAAREGLDVVLVEATSKFGGTTAHSGGGGVWFPGNPVLVRAGMDDDTIEDALTYYRTVAGDPIAGRYAAGNTMAAPSGTAYPGGGNPIGTSMLFSHLAVLDMRDRRA